LNGRIDQVSGEVKSVRDELGGRIDQVSVEIKEVRGEVTFIKDHLSAVLALGLSGKVETP
ncbi:MAG: hypothetical protein TE42_09795, partial [Candidatus Synechococcus spongiarum SP3]